MRIRADRAAAAPPPPPPPRPAASVRGVWPETTRPDDVAGRAAGDVNARRVASQMVQWSPGVTVLRVLDTATGEVLMQTPPEQVLHLVEGVMREMRERVVGDGND